MTKSCQVSFSSAIETGQFFCPNRRGYLIAPKNANLALGTTGEAVFEFVRARLTCR